MQRPINKIPITLVGRARRRLVKTILSTERLEASGMSPKRALIRSGISYGKFYGHIEDRSEKLLVPLLRMW